jgi:hypothetical protein
MENQHLGDFTFYGDLLGVGAAYQLSSALAYERLNEFYNTVFSFLFEKTQEGRNLKVYMFSDSVLIYGKQVERVLPQLQKIYLELFRKGLLLRGAIVDGRLRTEPRLEGDNFRKFLPKNDTLARAVGLEKTHKGARLLISPKLAESLLGRNRDWLTVDGYIRNAHREVETTSVLRRICPTPTGIAYELLYFWDPASPLSDYAAEKSTMNEIAQFLDVEAATHYRETISLLERSELRDMRTRQLLCVV